MADDWLTQFENDPSQIIYVLDSAFRLSYCNAAWDRFALDNGGSHLVRETQIGRNVIDITPAPLRRFYSTLFARALRRSEDIDHVYECSSDETFRLFRMRVKRTKADQGLCLVVTNTLILEQAQQRQEFRDDTQELRDENGLITMCCHCRRTRIPNAELAWEWIPGLVHEPPRSVSHGICQVCFDIHYKK